MYIETNVPKVIQRM